MYASKNWVLKEAMNTKQLLTQGTFQGALCSKLDEILAKIFSELLAVIDRNCNLSLLKENIPKSTISKLWIGLFEYSQTYGIDYDHLISERSHPRQIHLSETDFPCKFPFSWLIRELLDAVINQAMLKKGTTKRISATVKMS